MTYENAIKLAIEALNSTADEIEQTAKRWPWHMNQHQREQLQRAESLKAAAACLQAHKQKPR